MILKNEYAIDVHVCILIWKNTIILCNHVEKTCIYSLFIYCVQLLFVYLIVDFYCNYHCIIIDYFANIGSDLASNICADEYNEMYKQYLFMQSQCTMFRVPARMVVRRPAPINQLFNDESIAVHILFFGYLYVEIAMDAIEHRIN